METDPNTNVGHKGRFYLTKHIWVPQEPIENFNLKMSDMILKRMPSLPLGGEDALKAFPVRMFQGCRRIRSRALPATTRSWAAMAATRSKVDPAPIRSMADRAAMLILRPTPAPPRA